MGSSARCGLRRPGRPADDGPHLTTFHLVRHAAHALLPHTLAGRTPGIPLSPEGTQQAERLAARFAGVGVAAIISSPVQRAQETADPIARRLSLPVTPEPGFNEIDFGEWTGRRFDDLAPDPAWQAWNRLRSMATPPGGEAMHAAQSRALAAISRWRQAYPDQPVIVVSHADIIKAILAPALGLSLDHLHRLTVDPASVSTLVVFADDLRVDGLNRQ